MHYNSGFVFSKKKIKKINALKDLFVKKEFSYFQEWENIKLCTLFLYLILSLILMMAVLIIFTTGK